MTIKEVRDDYVLLDALKDEIGKLRKTYNSMPNCDSTTAEWYAKTIGDMSDTIESINNKYVHAVNRPDLKDGACP